MGGGPTPFEDLDEYLADIGDRIRAERQARGWTQNDLAERAALTRWALRALEDGVGTLLAFARACRALEVDMDLLLSDAWRMPALRLSLSPRQVDVLREAASGDSLAVVGARLGLDRPAVSSHLSRIYERLGVADLPVVERRAAAVRAAVEHNLITPPNRTS
jgi:DNA-binding CsgD family transcriptional regulator/DNA-binding XRE family transcriptional regulator